jgi:uncharacterized OsmC-like protein
MSDQHIYHAVIEMVDDRLADFILDDGNKPTIRVATPPEFPGGREGIISPEDLFVGAVASCKFTTFCAMAEKLRVDLASLKIDATGHITKEQGRGFTFTKIVIKLLIGITSEDQRKKAEKCVELTERYCLVTNSINSEVQMSAEITVQKKNEEK